MITKISLFYFILFITLIFFILIIYLTIIIDKILTYIFDYDFIHNKLYM